MPDFNASTYFYIDSADSGTTIMDSAQDSTTYAIEDNNIITFSRGLRYKIVKKFKINDIYLVVITNFKTQPIGQDRLFCVRKLDNKENRVFDKELPVNLLYSSFTSIKQSIEKSRSMLNAKV